MSHRKKGHRTNSDVCHTEKKGHRTTSDVCHTEKKVTEQNQMYVTQKKGHRTNSDLCHTKKKKVTEQTQISYVTHNKDFRTVSDPLSDTEQIQFSYATQNKRLHNRLRSPL